MTTQNLTPSDVPPGVPTGIPAAAPTGLPEPKWTDLNGPVHYVDFGGPADGPLVVCVHGLGGSLVNWLALAPLLTERCRVIALDLAGHGLTEALGRGTDVHSNRRLLDRFLREVTGTPAIVIGNSMGGLITVLQADKAGDTVAGMVLIDPALPRPAMRRPDPQVARTFVAYALPMVGERVLRNRYRKLPPERLVNDTLTLCCVDPTRVPQNVVQESIALVHKRAGQHAPEKAFLGAARSVLKLLARPQRYVAAIKRVPQPTLLLFGAKDRLVPLESGQRTATARPDWRFEVNPNVGHVPQLEDAGWSAKKIFDWLDEEGSPAVALAVAARP